MYKRSKILHSELDINVDIDINNLLRPTILRTPNKLHNIQVQNITHTTTNMKIPSTTQQHSINNGFDDFLEVEDFDEKEAANQFN
jgi:hypothetical protein